jgi:hypothetical protein
MVEIKNITITPEILKLIAISMSSKAAGKSLKPSAPRRLWLRVCDLFAGRGNRQR